MYGFYRTPFNKEGLLGKDREKSMAIQEFRDARNKLNYKKVTLVFGLQTLLLLCLLFYIIVLPYLKAIESGGSKVETQQADVDKEHYLVNYILFLVKPICCIFLHISM